MKISENQRKSMKIDENQWKSISNSQLLKFSHSQILKFSNSQIIAWKSWTSRENPNSRKPTVEFFLSREYVPAELSPQPIPEPHCANLWHSCLPAARKSYSSSSNSQNLRIWEVWEFENLRIWEFEDCHKNRLENIGTVRKQYNVMYNFPRNDFTNPTSCKCTRSTHIHTHDVLAIVVVRWVNPAPDAGFREQEAGCPLWALV